MFEFIIIALNIFNTMPRHISSMGIPPEKSEDPHMVAQQEQDDLLTAYYNMTDPEERAAGTITAAIIGASVSAAGIATQAQERVPPGTLGGCYWAGTAPFCGNNNCKRNNGEEKYMSLSDDPTGSIWTIKIQFGETCWWGAKALCCSRRQYDNTWSGLWEVAYKFTKQTCKLIESVSSSWPCGMKFACIDDHDHTNTWRIGGTNCQKLYWGNKLDAEVWPGKIVWEDSAWPKVHGKARRWYKVNASS